MTYEIAEVLLDISIHKTLDYKIPKTFLEKIQIGSWVSCPVRQKIRSGCVVALKESSSFSRLSEITDVISQGPVLTADLFQLMVWMARYYACPVERVLKSMLPKGIRHGVEQKKQYLVTRAKTRDELAKIYITLQQKAPSQAKILEKMLMVQGGILLTELLEETESSASSVKALEEKGYLFLENVKTAGISCISGERYFPTKPKILRQEQENALFEITESMEKGLFKTHLLWGVTGSGKTEVYLQAIEKALKLNKSALLLVPEISLTMQTIQRMKSRFSIPISVLHHRLSDGQRRQAWDDIREGRSRIVLGARSAIFSPLPNLGLIIVDEEHEGSYKQSDDSPTYNARDVAVMRGKITNATVVLGSATPSFESFYNAQNKKYSLIPLLERSGKHPLPTVHLVDMHRENEKAGGIALLSDPLIRKIDERIERGEQSIIFLNRRGYNTSCSCKNCSTVLKCTHCDTPFTFHKSSHILACHLCGLEIIPPKACPSCKQESLIQYRGAGTERVEATLKAILPHARTLRADFDTTRHKGSMDAILTAFRSGKADVLIGTQMIAKGLHFPEVTLVGVIQCDASLHIPDFRAAENVFQLITQVSGRSGRGFEKGEVLLQTSLPESSLIQHASKQDFLAFYQEEILVREMFGYPPYSHFVKISFVGPEEVEVQKVTQDFHDTIYKLLPGQYILHPPTPAGHAKVKDLFRYQILIRGPKTSEVTSLLEEVDRSLKYPPSIKRLIDVDPSTTFF